MKRDKNIDHLRIVAAIFVVLIHVSGSYIDTSVEFDNNFWVANLIQGFTRVSVPLFIIISGKYNISDREYDSKLFIQRRLGKIVLPLVFWSLFYSFFKMLIMIRNNSLNVQTLIIEFISGNSYYHLWYLYMMIPMILITPKLVELRNTKGSSWFIKFSILLCAIGVVVTTILHHLNIEEVWIFSFIKFLGYYTLGSSLKPLSKSNKKVGKWLLIGIYFLLSISITILSYLWIMNGLGHYWYHFSNPIIYLSSISLFVIFISREYDNFSYVQQIFAESSLGVYVIHPIILEIIRKFNFDNMFSSTILNVSIVVVITCSVSILITRILLSNKFLRKFV